MADGLEGTRTLTILILLAYHADSLGNGHHWHDDNISHKYGGILTVNMFQYNTQTYIFNWVIP